MIVLALAVVGSLVLASVIYNWALQFMDTDKYSPEDIACELESSYSDEGFFIVEVSKTRTEYTVASLEFSLEAPSGMIMEKHWGANIYQADIGFGQTNMSFQDHDRDGSLSDGDFLLLRSVELGGPAEEGWCFRIKYPYYEFTIEKVVLSKSSPLKDYPMARPNWTLEYLDTGNLSFDTNQSVVNHASSFTASELVFNLDFRYLGDNATTIRQSLWKEGELFTEENLSVSSGLANNFSANYSTSMSDTDHGGGGPARFTLDLVDTSTNKSLLTVNVSVDVFWAGCTLPSFSSSVSGVLLSVIVVVLGVVNTSSRRKRRKLCFSRD